MKYAIPLILSCSLLVACQSSERMKRAPDFIVGVCGECHAVTANGVSPIADAPEFGDIANTPGLTRETLEAFLSDAHNYPMQMDLDLDQTDIKSIVDHIMAMQSEKHMRRPS